MDQDDLHKLTAAILTLSQGLDAVHELMRKELSFNVDIHGTKIHERFIPKRLVGTEERFGQWRKEISTDPIEPLEPDEKVPD